MFVSFVGHHYIISHGSIHNLYDLKLIEQWAVTKNILIIPLFEHKAEKIVNRHLYL